MLEATKITHDTVTFLYEIKPQLRHIIVIMLCFQILERNQNFYLTYTLYRQILGDFPHRAKSNTKTPPPYFANGK